MATNGEVCVSQPGRAGGDGKRQFCRFVVNLNLITAVMIDHFFDILLRCRFGIECENSLRHFRSLEASKLKTVPVQCTLKSRTDNGYRHVLDRVTRGRGGQRGCLRQSAW